MTANELCAALAAVVESGRGEEDVVLEDPLWRPQQGETAGLYLSGDAPDADPFAVVTYPVGSAGPLRGVCRNCGAGIEPIPHTEVWRHTGRRMRTAALCDPQLPDGDRGTP